MDVNEEHVYINVDNINNNVMFTYSILRWCGTSHSVKIHVELHIAIVARRHF